MVFTRIVSTGKYDAGTTKQIGGGEAVFPLGVLCAAAHRRNAIGQLKNSAPLLSLLPIGPLKQKNSMVIA